MGSTGTIPSDIFTPCITLKNMLKLQINLQLDWAGRGPLVPDLGLPDLGLPGPGFFLFTLCHALRPEHTLERRCLLQNSGNHCIWPEAAKRWRKAAAGWDTKELWYS